MTDLLLEDLTFTPILVDGRQSNWLIASDGRVLPNVRGADDGDGDGDGDGVGGADGGDDKKGSGDDADKKGGDDKAGAGDDNTGSDTKVEMTQAELDKLVADAKSKGAKKAADEAAEAAKRAKMDEAELAKTEKADAEKAATEATERANAKLVLADAKVAAVEAGVKADRLATFMRLVNLDGIDVDDDGEVDAKAVKAAIAAGLKEAPEFKAGAAGPGKSGEDHTGDGKGKPTTLAGAVAAQMAKKA